MTGLIRCDNALIVDRYQAAGLQHNPFAFEVAEIASVFVDRGLPSPPAVASRTLLQVIGDKGAGKTTQVQFWRRARPGPYHYVPETPYRGRWERPPVAPLVYADEVDRMPAPLRSRWLRQLARTNATVVVGTHADLASHARRAGLQVITHRLGPVDLDTMRAIVAQRLRASAHDSHATFELDDHHIITAHAHAGGSIRIAEGLLHQKVAELVAR